MQKSDQTFYISCNNYFLGAGCVPRPKIIFIRNNIFCLVKSMNLEEIKTKILAWLVYAALPPLYYIERKCQRIREEREVFYI